MESIYSPSLETSKLYKNWIRWYWSFRI